MNVSDFIGHDFEDAYAKAFHGAVVGGLQDSGKDIAVPGFGFVQIKASVAGAREFLSRSLKRHQFIPVCVGEPGVASEMIKSLEQFGGWVGREIPHRMDILKGVLQVKMLCGS